MIKRALPFALGVLLAASGSAEQAAPAAKPAAPASKSDAAAVEAVLEPKAIELLKAASSRLAAARSMTFTAVVGYESPSRIGPALLYTTRSTVTLQRPDKLRVITPGDGPASEFYYDGKSITAFAPVENLVAVGDAPATIDAALEEAYHKAAIYFPFTDVIVADPYAELSDGLTDAFYIGRSDQVGATTTDMVAVVNRWVFQQIWIGADDKLPRRVRAVFRDDPLQLRHEIDFANWKLDPVVPADAFASPRAGAATRIQFAAPEPVLPPGVEPRFEGERSEPK